MAKIPIFISAPKSYLLKQEEFVAQIEELLCTHDLAPITLGRSDYDIAAPLEAIRRLMNGSCGLLCIALRRTFITHGSDRPHSDMGEKEQTRDGSWLTSPYCQIEPAMAYQIGLPILMWRESGVNPDGMLDRGAIGLSMPEFDLENPPVLSTPQWKQPLSQWIDLVRLVYRKRGDRPKLW